MGDRACFGDDDFVAHEQGDLLGPIHLVPKEHPKQRGPRYHRREKALDSQECATRQGSWGYLKRFVSEPRPAPRAPGGPYDACQAPGHGTQRARSPGAAAKGVIRVFFPGLRTLAAGDAWSTLWHFSYILKKLVAIILKYNTILLNNALTVGPEGQRR